MHLKRERSACIVAGRHWPLPSRVQGSAERGEGAWELAPRVLSSSLVVHTRPTLEAEPS